MKKEVITIVILAVIIRLILTIVVNDSLLMNPDEERNYKIALNNQNGLGYTIFNFTKQEYTPSAFHASFPVLTYEALIKFGIKKEYGCCS